MLVDRLPEEVLIDSVKSSAFSVTEITLQKFHKCLIARDREWSCSDI